MSESCSAVGPHRGGVCYAQARVCELCLGVGLRTHTTAFFDTYSSVCVCVCVHVLKVAVASPKN